MNQLQQQYIVEEQQFRRVLAVLRNMQEPAANLIVDFVVEGLLPNYNYNVQERIQVRPQPQWRNRLLSPFCQPRPKTKALKKADVHKSMTDICGICFENHTMIDCATTQCGHTFGAKCFQQWIDTKKSAQHLLTCPMCNQSTTELTTYRRRKNSSF